MDEETTGIRLAGLGGQGVVLAGLLLGHAAVYDGLHAAGSNSYGSQSRGSLSTADVVISHTAIDYPHIELASILVAMSQEGYDAYAGRLKAEGVILFDSGLVATHAGTRNQKRFDVTATSIDSLKDRQAANVIWTGILAGVTGLFSQKGLELAIRANVPESHIESNLRALTLGIMMGKRT